MRASCKHLLNRKLTNQDRSALIGSPLAESEQQRQPMSQLLF